MKQNPKINNEQSQEVSFGGLEDSCGFLIKVAQVDVFEHFQEAQGKYGLQLGAVTVLIMIESNPGIRHGVLARALHIKLAHMTKLIKSFELKGLVKRSNPVSDRRSVELTLTDEGRVFVDTMRPLMFTQDDLPPGRLDRGEREQLMLLLRKFVGM